jgi:tyrosinase
MATYLRNNSWNNGGDFSNSDLLWYAKGVGKMMSRALNDPASWWFYAAIHGEYVNPKTAWYVTPPAFPDWGFITPLPKVPASPLPSQGSQDLYWNQCQHGSWYFLPWHRGYLLSLEAQLRQDIISLGGPATWALPYWSYFGGNNGSQYQMPPAFAAKTLPDGSANPLYVAMRYGPDGDANIYIPTPAGEAAHPGDPNYTNGGVSDSCMSNDLYTGADTQTPLPGFGGPASSFAHFGSPHGNVESNPHDLVHVYAGNVPDPNSPIFGLMADPGTAALDPIFYLHHANIDRMWAVWNASGNSNPTDRNWLNGPSTRRFAMPGPGTAPWYYTPMQMGNLNALDYTYQELPTLPAALTIELAQRLTLLGAPAPGPVEKAKRRLAAMTLPTQTELFGSNEGPLRIQGPISQTSVKLDSGVNRKFMQSLAAPSENALPDNVYLKLENVRGTTDASVLGVYLNLPENAKPRDSLKFLAGHVALFGLRRASVKDGEHGGDGLTFLLDVTRILDELHLAKAMDVGSLRVSIVPSHTLSARADITVGRISLYRQAH